MANGPPTAAGTTEQKPSTEDLLWAQIATAVQGGAKQIPAPLLHQLEQVIADKLAQVDRSQLGSNVSTTQLVDSFLPNLPPAVRAAIKQALDALAQGVTHGVLVGNGPQDSPVRNQPSGADPIQLASGQLLYRHLDLFLDGAGAAIHLRRTYRSQGRYPRGPLGGGWDHNLNLWIREVSPTELAVASGELREDRYRLTTPRQGAANQDVYFTPPDGSHSVVHVNNAGSYDLLRPDGLRYVFRQSTEAGIHRVDNVVDPLGNYLKFTYVDPSTTTIAVNHPTRVIVMRYDDLGRLVALGDYSGRLVRYTYDDYDDLVGVTLPATHDHPRGRTLCYEYNSPLGPSSHQLLSVSDADGRRYLDVEYGYDTGFANGGRVVRQRDDQGEWLVEYADLEPTDPLGPDVAVRYTELSRPNGQTITHWFNPVGNLVAKAESGFDEDGLRRTYLWKFRYNADGEVVGRATPEGVVTQDLYGREAYLLARGREATSELADDIAPTADERRSFGDHLGLIRRSNPASRIWPPPAIDQTFAGDLITRFTYEPRCHRLATQSDPRGTTSLDPGLAAPGVVYAYDANGSLTSLTHPSTTHPDGSVEPQAVSSYDHDGRGRLLTETDPEGHIVSHRYFESTDTRDPNPLPSNQPPLVPPIPVSIEGYLHTTTVAHSTAAAATTTFDVNARGVPVAVTDPRGGRLTTFVDSTDNPYRVERVLKGTGNQADIIYATQFAYTLEGKPRRTERGLLDETGAKVSGGTELRLRKYGDTGLLTRESFGSDVPESWLITRYIYDAEGLPSRTISPLGNTTRYQHDLRRLLRATTRGYGTGAEATERINYDGDGRKRATFDSRGNVVRFDYDQLGRLRQSVQIVDRPLGAADDRPVGDREGHIHAFTYDALDKVVLERFFEWLGPNDYALLTRTSTEYDERGRRIRTTSDLFDKPISASPDSFVAGPPPGSVAVETWSFLDSNGRPTELREGVVTKGQQPSPGRSTVYEYDAAGHQTSVTVQTLGSKSPGVVTKTALTRDPNGNVVRTDRYAYEYDAKGQQTQVEVISTAAEFDSLNRCVAETDALGNTRHHRYDSRDLVIETSGPLGEIARFDYDVYGRRVRATHYVAANDAVVSAFDFDADGQLILFTRGDLVDVASRSAFEYDALHRRTAIVLAPGTPVERRYVTGYDTAGNIIKRELPTGLREDLVYDALNRVVASTFDRTAVDPGQPVLGTATEHFEHDALGRVTRADNDFSSVEIQFDSLSRQIVERQTLGQQSTFEVSRRFDALGNATQVTYPSGRKLKYVFDGVGRLASVLDVERGTPNVGLQGNGVRAILERTHVGARRRTDRYFNGTHSSCAYDAAGRLIRLEVKDGNDESLRLFVQLFDGAGNPRHEWRLDGQSPPRSYPYEYDAMHRLLAVGSTQAPPPNVAPLAPPPTPANVLSGQVDIDLLLAPLAIPPKVLDRSYTYDSGGNRVAETPTVGVPTAYAIDSLDELIGRTSDQNGNPVTVGGWRYFYDEHNRLVQVTQGGKLVFEATYDGCGRRASVVDGGAVRRFAYDRDSLISEYLQGALVIEHVATGADERVHVASGLSEYGVTQDWVGSTRLLTNPNGQIVARYDFDPYGRAATGNVQGPPYRHLFMAKEWDSTINLYHFPARHYEPETARFMQRDPAASEPQASAYQAFRSSPLAFVDPSGRRNVKTGEALLSPYGGMAVSSFVNGKWMLPGLGTESDPVFAGLGSDAHRAILEYYKSSQQFPELVRGNYYPVSSLAKMIAMGAAGGLKMAGVQVLIHVFEGSRLKPDVLNTAGTTPVLYEIKPAWQIPLAAAEAKMYQDTFARSGYHVELGPMFAAGTYGTMPVKDGNIAFFTPLPGVIAYMYFKGDVQVHLPMPAYAPSTVPQEVTSPLSGIQPRISSPYPFGNPLQMLGPAFGSIPDVVHMGVAVGTMSMTHFEYEGKRAAGYVAVGAAVALTAIVFAPAVPAVLAAP